jgi:hypothetical protein
LTAFSTAGFGRARLARLHPVRAEPALLASLVGPGNAEPTVGSVWPVIERAITEAPCPVVTLPVDAVAAGRCLATLRASTRTWLGALVAESGGLLIDHGWLRVLGGGSTTPELPDVASANGLPGGGVERLVVAYDVLGGQFALLPGAGAGAGHEVAYFAPDSLAWEPLGVDYAAWLAGMLSGGTEDVYAGLRWPGWQPEVADVSIDHGIRAWPPPFTVEGRDLASVERRTVPIGELFQWYAAAAAERA